MCGASIGMRLTSNAWNQVGVTWHWKQVLRLPREDAVDVLKEFEPMRIELDNADNARVPCVQW